jgi:uncharacterized protein
MRPFTGMLLFAALLHGTASSLLAQTAAGPSGHWEGTIQASGMDVPVEIDLATSSQGEFAGTFGQPAQHLKGLPLVGVSVHGTSIAFQIKGGAPGDRTFKGTLSAEGTTMSGEFTSRQVGTIAFTLTRTGDARIDATPASAAIGKELEGTWTGTLEVNGMQLRLALTTSNQADGTATGGLVNLDEGLELPITAIVQKASAVTFDVMAIGGSYSGSLNSEGTELIGAFTQGSQTAPMTFRRAAVVADKK